mmetsp:Transcript_15880/g.40984  ORF Transcript_15880/g.40984 Transcript_15880/m.40984 type:complete len:296 (-) Transcript_15880:498-1385(-)
MAAGRFSAEVPPSQRPPCQTWGSDGRRPLSMSRSAATLFRPPPGEARSSAVAESGRSQPRTLRVTVVRARNLPHASPFCVCHIPGKSRSKFRTPVVEDTADPEWNFEARIPDFAACDTLVFTVYDRKAGWDDDVLGSCTLKGRHLGSGDFEGEVPLLDTGAEENRMAFLRVKISEEFIQQLSRLMHVLGPRYKALPQQRRYELANSWSQETLLQRKLRRQQELEVSRSQDCIDPIAHLRPAPDEEEGYLVIAGELPTATRRQIASGQSVHRFAASQLTPTIPSIHPGATSSRRWY